MEIILNGVATQVSQRSSIEDLLAEIGVPSERIAIELNQEVIPKSEYSSRQLHAADRIEIIQAVGGG
jgi:sulfur carrier protein